MIENLIRRAMGYTGNVFAEFRNDPTHWSNNKRRLHGMGPLRKQSNRKGRKNMFSAVLCNALAETINSIWPVIVEDTISSLQDVRKLP